MFVAITLVTYVIFFVIPTDTVRVVQGRSSIATDLRQTAHLHGTVAEQYVEFLHQVVTHGSLGTSFFSDKSVNSLIGNAIPVTLSLVLGGAVMWLLIALPIGIFSALRPRSLLDRAGMVLVLIGISAHPIWLGLVFAYVFGFKLRWLPITGYCDMINPSTRCGGPVQWFYHLVLPWLTFAAWYAAFYVRMIRASVLEAINEDYVRTARAKGASEWMIVKSHVLRNALLPVAAMVAADVSTMGFTIVGSTIFVEQVYGLPGIGQLLVAALQRHDLPIVEGVVVFVTTAVIVLNLLVDLLYSLVDPRIHPHAATV
jgi:peptide/nickel transport system permease protein